MEKIENGKVILTKDEIHEIERGLIKIFSDLELSRKKTISLKIGLATKNIETLDTVATSYEQDIKRLKIETSKLGEMFNMTERLNKIK